jgi:hypothetical protein
MKTTVEAVIHCRETEAILLWHWDSAANLSLSSVLAAIPPILDGIVTSVIEPAGDLGPAFAHFFDETFNLQTLLWRNGVMVKRWLEVLMVSLTTLLGGS